MRFNLTKGYAPERHPESIVNKVANLPEICLD